MFTEVAANVVRMFEYINDTCVTKNSRVDENFTARDVLLPQQLQSNGKVRLACCHSEANCALH
jgi:hypothetical protein